MKQKNPNQMSREDATKLYRDLRSKVDGAPKAVETERKAQPAMRSRSRIAAPQITKGISVPSFNLSMFKKFRGQQTALGLVILFTCAKIAIAGLEYVGVGSVTEAQATAATKSEEVHAMLAPAAINIAPKTVAQPKPTSKEDVAILGELDKRRADLEERNERLNQRENDLTERESAMVAKLNELRSLTERLKMARQQDEHKRDNQLDQLSKVYSAMNPDEAAHLMEQLDVTIALQLIERMPEKRIGQILALMSSGKALQMTKLLSGSR